MYKIWISLKNINLNSQELEITTKSLIRNIIEIENQVIKHFVNCTHVKMTIIIFLVDSSASMNQRTYLCGRTSILDVAKGAVETFIKVRQRVQESRGDRYMLLNFEEPPHNIKSGFKENLNTFKSELKNLQSSDLTTIGSALKNTFDVLNLNRMQTGIDTYGQGRCPFYLEPSVIILITDGGKYSSTAGVINELHLPMHNSIPGSELTHEPFRWDQRLYALVLRLAGTPCNDREIGVIPSDHSPIDAMCEITGGRSYLITSQVMIAQSIDNLVQRIHSGVVINFERMTSDADVEQMISDLNEEYQIEDNNDWHSCRKMIFVPRSGQKEFAIGFWPLPESFWPDVNTTVLPPRRAHPKVRFTCTNQDPMIIENLPFDKYELESSPLTQYILARKQSTTCWQVFIPNSYKTSDTLHPFGYLKASTSLTCVNLFVLPYNYPVLLHLLDELFKDLRLKSTPEWIQKFRNYITQMPSYYAGPLRRALTRMGVPSSLITALIPDSYDTMLSLTVLNYLKKVKNQAKVEFDRLCNEVALNNQLKNDSPIVKTTCIRVNSSNLKGDLVTHPDYRGKFLSLNNQINEFGGFTIGLPAPNTRSKKSFRNPYDTQRSRLLDQAVRMRTNLLQSLNRIKLVDDDVLHTLPVSEMGNYQEYLKRMPMPLREIESAPVRRHMFGNPFKTDKRMMVDEADIDLVGGTSSIYAYKSGKRHSESVLKQLPVKRKPGPIPKNYKFEPSSKPEKCALEKEEVSAEIPNEIKSEKMTSILPPIIEESIDKQVTIDNECHNQSIRSSPLKIKKDIVENKIPFRHSLPEVVATPLHSRLNNTLNRIPISSQTVQMFNSSPKRINTSCPENVENMDPSTSDGWNKTSIMHHNLKMKRMLFVDVRRPGKDYRLLMDHLRQLKGDFHDQEIIIKQVYNESLRFKRANLAREIINFLQVFRSESELKNTL